MNELTRPYAKPKTARDRALVFLGIPTALALQFLRSLRQNLGLALLSLVLSTILWVLVSNDLNPARVDVFPNPIPVQTNNIPPGMAVFSVIDPVKIRISAPQELWSRLRSDSFTAYVDLSKATPGAQSYPVIIQRPDPQISIREVIPDKVTVRVEIVKSRSVPVYVNLSGGVPLGWTNKHPKPAVQEVTVTGPEAAVNRVERAEADISLEGATLTISQTFPLVPTDGRGNKIDDVRLEPNSVNIEVPIEQQVYLSTVPINPAVTGNVAPGYWLSGITVEPSTVMLVGDRDALQAITFVRTVPVDVSGASEDVTQAVGLDLPQGVSPASAQKVTVRASVSPVIGTKTFAVAPNLNGIPNGWQGSANPVNVTVSGPISVLRDMYATDIVVTLDVTGLPAGTHVVAPKVTIPPRTELVTISPEKVSVTIQPSSQPPPTPGGG